MTLLTLTNFAQRAFLPYASGATILFCVALGTKRALRMIAQDELDKVQRAAAQLHR